MTNPKARVVEIIKATVPRLQPWEMTGLADRLEAAGVLAPEWNYLPTVPDGERPVNALGKDGSILGVLFVNGVFGIWTSYGFETIKIVAWSELPQPPQGD